MLAIKRKRSAIHASRAYLPSDTSPESRRYNTVRFAPEHEDRYSVLNFETMKVGKEQTRLVPDLILCNGNSYRLVMSVCREIHVLRDEDAAEIERLDREIAQLMERRQAVLDESFKRGRALHQRDIDPNWDGNHSAA